MPQGPESPPNAVVAPPHPALPALAQLVRKETNFVGKTVEASSYSYVDVNPNSETTLSLTSAAYSTFEIDGFNNLSKSTYDFDITIPAQGATEFTQVLNRPPWKSISASNKSGGMLFDLPNFQAYWAGVVLPMIAKEEWELADGPGVSSVSMAGAKKNGRVTGVHYSDSSYDTDPVSVGVDHSVVLTSTASLTDNITNREYRNPINFYSGAVNSPVYMAYKVPFKYLIHTILSQNIDFDYGSTITLKIEWLPMNKFARTVTTITSNAGAADITVVPTLSHASHVIKLAKQDNIEILRTVNQRLVNGMNMYVPYVTQETVEFTTTTASATKKLNASEGTKVARVYFQTVVSDESNLKISNMYNASSANITTLNEVVFDGKPRDHNLSFEEGDVFHRCSRFIRNPAFNSQAAYTTFIGSLYIYDMGYHDDSTLTGFHLSKEFPITFKVTKPALQTTAIITTVYFRVLRADGWGNLNIQAH